MFVSTGLRVQSQVQTSTGRIDMLIETTNHFMILEFKIDGSSEEALTQIKDKEYAKGLIGKSIVGVGVVFDLSSKSISEWKQEVLN